MNFRLNYPQHAPYLFAFGIALLCLPFLLQWQQTKDWVEYDIVAKSVGTTNVEDMTFDSVSPSAHHNWGGRGSGGSGRLAMGARYGRTGAYELLHSVVVSWRANGQIIEVPMELAPPSPEVLKRVREEYGFEVNGKFIKNRLDLIFEVDADHQRAWGYWQEIWVGGPSYRHADPREDEWWPARQIKPVPAPTPRQKDPLEVEFLKETP